MDASYLAGIGNTNAVSILTDSFLEKDVDRLVAIINKKFGFHSYKFLHNSGKGRKYFHIHIPNDDYSILAEKIKQSIHPSML
jgi:hypothetical protein